MARRASGTSTYILSNQGANNHIRWGAANVVEVLGNGNPVGATATDNTWNAVQLDIAGTATAQFRNNTNGVASGPTLYGNPGSLSGVLCLGSQSTGVNFMTGDIAEAGLISGQVAASPNYASPAAAVFTALQNAWGSLPH